eukprot:c13434_g1_i2 orf=381-578(-)
MIALHFVMVVVGGHTANAKWVETMSEFPAVATLVSNFSCKWLDVPATVLTLRIQLFNSCDRYELF